jgi:hypothetical protein
VRARWDRDLRRATLIRVTARFEELGSGFSLFSADQTPVYLEGFRTAVLRSSPAIMR